MPGRIVPLEQARRTLEDTRERVLGRVEEVRARRLGGSPEGIMPEIQRRINKRMAMVRERRPMVGGEGTGALSSSGRAGGVKSQRYYAGQVRVVGTSEEAKRRERIVRGVPIKLH